MSNRIFIGTSIDGYIADRDGGLGFLECVPNPDSLDFGFQAFVDSVDAILMGRVTLETVLGFNCPWPYTKPVFVLSSTMKTMPEELQGKVEIVSGEIKKVVSMLNEKGFIDLYIDGGKLIQSFLAEDMIDEINLTRVPMLLGGGTPLFGALPKHLEFEHAGTEVLLGSQVQSNYRRKR